MPWFVWVALAVFLVGFVGGATWLAVKSMRLWRHGWPVVQRVSAAADELAPRVMAIESGVVHLEPRLADLQRSVVRLKESTRRAQILLDVVLEAKRTVDFARAFVPRR